MKFKGISTFGSALFTFLQLRHMLVMLKYHWIVLNLR